MKLSAYKIVFSVALFLVIPLFVSNALSIRAESDIAEALLALKDKPSNQTWAGTLIGTDTGLYTVRDGEVTRLWSGGAVHKILRGPQWYFLTSQGIIVSEDLERFEERNTGLPSLTIKEFRDGEKTFSKQQATLKDLSMHPADPNTLVTLTRDAVFLSQDGGLSWKNMGFCHSTTNGAKAVAVCSLPVNGKDTLTIFLSHSTNGLYYLHPEAAKPTWTRITGGLEVLPGQSSEEIADILPVLTTTPDGGQDTTVYLSQTFLPCLYKLDWNAKRFVLLGRGSEPADTIDGIFTAGNRILYTRPDGFGSFNLDTETFSTDPMDTSAWEYLSELAGPACNTLYIPEEASSFGQPLNFSELWLLKPTYINGKFVTDANNKKALYVPVGKAYTKDMLQGFIDTINKNNLNALVIDMKDDYGLLRYDSRNPDILRKAKTSMYALNLDSFVKQCKENDIYLIARIVAFKDKNLWGYQNGTYAVKDSSTGAGWLGIQRYETVTDDDGNETSEPRYYDEYWVDPYCEEVWQYNVAIAQELIERGFDEIQYDYIRFPTDGRNLSKATYKWRDPGMDKESALVSFLRYARENLNVPIGIDIYGANGWYRSGARTGQDVELLSQYVDVICPMFYPSHFDQDFLAEAPAAERPYRIYFYGCYRNTVIARNRVIVRPWAQAFYLAVSYDKRYYDEDYVARQIYGTRDSIDRGYMYWNNIGRYGDVRPDPADGTPSPYRDEGAAKKPVLGYTEDS